MPPLRSEGDTRQGVTGSGGCHRQPGRGGSVLRAHGNFSNAVETTAGGRYGHTASAPVGGDADTATMGGGGTALHSDKGAVGKVPGPAAHRWGATAGLEGSSDGRVEVAVGGPQSRETDRAEGSAWGHGGRSLWGHQNSPSPTRELLLGAVQEGRR